MINDEKKKNDSLDKDIKRLNNIFLNINSKIKELENEINLFRSYYKYTEGEKLISIKFNSVDQEINFNIITKNTEIFS